MTTINSTDPVEAVLRANGWSQATLTADMTVPVYLIETNPRLILPGQIGEYSPLIGVDVLRPPYPVGTVIRSAENGSLLFRHYDQHGRAYWVTAGGMPVVDAYTNNLPDEWAVVYTPAADYTQAGEQA